ncbi:hypothetical protein [Deinococcus radiophilus]|uniref:hypothetical protein n=1 Tax=Deinococcus radiophilus TaxID=32062 RepID=UPI003614B9EB
MTLPTPTVTVRERRPADLPALEEVLLAVHQQSGYPASWPQEPAAFIAPPGGDAWVAELDGAVVGQACCAVPRTAPGAAGTT